MSRRVITLFREGFPTRLAFDTAVSRALLEAAAAGTGPEAFRLFVPGRVLAFGSRDAAHPGYPAACNAARAEGFAPVERLAGGRAAVFHEGTLAFAWAIPDPEPRRSIHLRFRELAAVVVEALASLGVDARVGEVPGEYCPGEYSVNAGGRRKLMGVGQRLVAGAAHVGGVVVVDRPDLVNRALTPVYALLGFAWDPAVTGSVADTAEASVDQVADALAAALARRADLEEAPLPPSVLERAEALAALAPPPR
ncbi:MAG: lipoate--protein ligase family protein [Acidimicrobiia bacterium]|jgi:lipoate-protein ligase A|nr:lipoate--protein ligase family protein [Acidimicrobiia bacterium]